MTFGDSARVIAPDEARVEVVIGQKALLTHDWRRPLPDLAHALEEREEAVGNLDRCEATAEACRISLVFGGVTIDSS